MSLVIVIYLTDHLTGPVVVVQVFVMRIDAKHYRTDVKSHC